MSGSAEPSAGEREGLAPRMDKAPLAGVRIVDLSRNVAGPYASYLLAQFGADVVKVEPPGGDPSRRFGPFPDDVANPGVLRPLTCT